MPPNTYQIHEFQVAHVSRAPGRIGSRERWSKGSPLLVTGTGLAIAGVGTFAVATALVSVPAALVLGGTLGLMSGSVTAVGLDLGATQINETFGTSPPSTGLLRPIRRGRFPAP